MSRGIKMQPDLGVCGQRFSLQLTGVAVLPKDSSDSIAERGTLLSK